jgi:ribosomal-protein-alanine N-acetyltransferase
MDLDAVLAIERASFRSPWSRRLFEQELSNPLSRGWVALGPCPSGLSGKLGPQGDLLAYVCVWVVHEEMHIMNLATHPSCRRQGVARALLGRVLAHAREAGVGRILLEVRPSNAAAQSLYSSLDFRVVGTRPGYYQDTGEDALIMIKELHGES